MQQAQARGAERGRHRHLLQRHGLGLQAVVRVRVARRVATFEQIRVTPAEGSCPRREPRTLADLCAVKLKVTREGFVLYSPFLCVGAGECEVARGAGTAGGPGAGAGGTHMM